MFLSRVDSILIYAEEMICFQRRVLNLPLTGRRGQLLLGWFSRYEPQFIFICHVHISFSILCKVEFSISLYMGLNKAKLDANCTELLIPTDNSPVYFLFFIKCGETFLLLVLEVGVLFYFLKLHLYYSVVIIFRFVLSLFISC